MQPSEIIDFWYSDTMRKHWFSSTPELDREIKDKYEGVWERAAEGEFDHWQDTPEGALALVIVLDQFPLNMFRSDPRSFQTERKAVEVSRAAIGKGFDNELGKDRLGFLFMPLMHGENLEDQDLSVEKFGQHGLTDNLRFAEHHRGIIRLFGRFPHRNAILGRENTRAEDEYLASKEAFLG